MEVKWTKVDRSTADAKYLLVFFRSRIYCARQLQLGEIWWCFGPVRARRNNSVHHRLAYTKAKWSAKEQNTLRKWTKEKHLKFPDNNKGRLKIMETSWRPIESKKLMFFAVFHHDIYARLRGLHKITWHDPIRTVMSNVTHNLLPICPALVVKICFSTKWMPSWPFCFVVIHPGVYWHWTS